MSDAPIFRIQKCKYVFTDGENKGSTCTRKSSGEYCDKHSPASGKCKHIMVRGKNTGKLCGKPAKSGDYCSAHAPKQYTLDTSGNSISLKKPKKTLGSLDVLAKFVKRESIRTKLLDDGHLVDETSGIVFEKTDDGSAMAIGRWRNGKLLLLDFNAIRFCRANNILYDKLKIEQDEHTIHTSRTLIEDDDDI